MQKNGNNANIGIRGFTMWKRKIPVTKYYLKWVLNPGLWWTLSFLTNLTFACKTETLGFLYSHALLILTGSSKSKNQVVYEQKFKDLLSSTCQVSPEKIELDLESGV